MRGPWQGPRGPPSHDPAGDCPSPAPCSNLSWLSYGTLKGDGTLIVVNAVGAALQTLYISAYVHYCPRKVDALPCTPPPRLQAVPCWQDKHCFLEDQQAGTATFSWKAPPAVQFSLQETGLRLSQAPLLARLGALPSLVGPCCPASCQEGLLSP